MLSPELSPLARAKMTPHGPLSLNTLQWTPPWLGLSFLKSLECVYFSPSALMLTIPTPAIISLAWTFLSVLLEFAA